MTPDEVRIERVPASRLPSFDLARVPFGSEMSDHMLVADFEKGAWGAPRIVPYGPMALPPSISALHYGLSLFEGMKAHRSPRGDVLLFRPEMNARRMVRSAERLSMPPVPPERFLAWLRALLDVDADWVPPGDQGALYVRPCLFSIDPRIGVRPPEACRFVIFTFPFAAYFKGSIDVLVSERYVRAFPGGTGDVKPAGNYAPAFIADREAAAVGCQASLWLDAVERRYVEECGVMNVFFVIGDAVVTPPLTGTILPGITRDSVITLLRDMGQSVREEPVAIADVARAHEQGALKECFGTGTAATITHVRRIRWREKDLVMPPVEERRVGPAVRERLSAVLTGRERDPHGWVVPLDRLGS